MARIFLSFFALLFMSNVYAKKVLFTVNMSGQIASSAGVHLQSDFQTLLGWGTDFSPSDSCIMTQDLIDTNLYHLFVNLPAFQKYEYIFVNGDQYEVETIPFASQVDSNNNEHRWIYIDSLNDDTLKLAPLVFDENAPAGLTMIRFVVDMTKETVSPNGVHIAGSFQSNDPTTHRLYSFSNNKYQIMCYMPAGANYTYKFYNGNISTTSEIVPASCASAGERSINLTQDIYLPSVCFSECATCYPSGVNEIAKLSGASIFPNPMITKSMIKFNDAGASHSVAIFDLAGRMAKEYNQVKDEVLEIDHVNLRSGVYTISIANELGDRVVKKLIVE